ncbi:MAG: ATP-grasp domain-containing protein [Planctomycetota bacterium]
MPLVVYGASVRWAAQSLSRAGWTVMGMDVFGDRDTRRACAQWQPLPAKDIAATAETWAADLGGRCLVVGGIDSTECTRWTQWCRVAADARSLGIRVPDTYRIVDERLQFWADEIDDGVPNRRSHQRGNAPLVSRRWLSKSLGGTGGLHVRRIDESVTVDTQSGVVKGGFEGESRFEKRSESFFEPRESRAADQGDGLIQAEIHGTPLGLIALASPEHVRLVGVCRSMVGGMRRCNDSVRRPFAYAGSIGPCAMDRDVGDPLRRLALRTARRCQLSGLFNIDLVQDFEGGLWFLEVNSRPSASCEVLERSLQRQGILRRSESLLDWHLDAQAPGGQGPAGSVVNPMKPNVDDPDWLIAKRIVYSGHAGVWDVSDLPWTRSRQDGDWTIRVGDIGRQGLLISRGDPIATLLMEAPRNLANRHQSFPSTLRRWIRRVQSSVA